MLQRVVLTWGHAKRLAGMLRDDAGRDAQRFSDHTFHVAAAAAPPASPRPAG